MAVVVNPGLDRSAGCTFDEDSDPSLCEFSQGEEDDFDWQLFRTHTLPHAIPDLLHDPLATVIVAVQ
ncbi:hypothetical protein QTP70_000691 [Hemibagrus guttatus]|uniref:MAM domain-containing protein n=1 Tax=Hemibagrus guttatus TaxID=175788 RepID=A0AAE0VCQ5_9TELE|nr:hypothetical protein QTP70_000691 [Hemibagrus guttatus]